MHEIPSENLTFEITFFVQCRTFVVFLGRVKGTASPNTFDHRKSYAGKILIAISLSFLVTIEYFSQFVGPTTKFV